MLTYILFFPVLKAFQGVNVHVAASIQTYAIYILSAHVGQNLEVCLSAHGHLPGILWYIQTPHKILSYIFVNLSRLLIQEQKKEITVEAQLSIDLSS